MWSNLINQGNEQIEISLSGVKIGYVNSRLSTSTYFNHTFWLKYWIAVNLAVLES